jgi:hypothetical protein
MKVHIVVATKPDGRKEFLKKKYQDSFWGQMEWDILRCPDQANEVMEEHHKQYPNDEVVVWELEV